MNNLLWGIGGWAETLPSRYPAGIPVVALSVPLPGEFGVQEQLIPTHSNQLLAASTPSSEARFADHFSMYAPPWTPLQAHHHHPEYGRTHSQPGLCWIILVTEYDQPHDDDTSSSWSCDYLAPTVEG
jgi:hypothetical protein